MRKVRFCIIIVLLSFLFSAIITEAADTSLEKDLQGYLSQSRVILEQLRERLQSGMPIANQLEALQRLAEEIKASHLLIMEQFRLREEKVGAHGSKALERHRVMSEEYRRAVEEYLSLLDDLLMKGSITFTDLDRLKALLDQILPVKKRPILGSLPYRSLRFPAREPNQASSIKPAYKGGDKAVRPDDLKSTAEAPITETIAELAQSLSWNPVLIYEWVKNNIETEWYWGSMKGAEETLRQRAGNDCDQASLLIALLRASGFPTRYVRGVIEFFPDIEKAKNLTGIDDPTKITEFFQKAGIPFTPIIRGGRISNFELEHIWVETQVPYANYRGAIIDEHGKTWLGLDTSIKVTGYTYNTPIDILQEISLSNLRDEYLSTLQTQTPLEYLRSSIDSYLATRNPPPGTPSPVTYNDLLRTKTLIPEVMNILPASMQFDQKRITHEYTEIPDELKHKINIIATRNAQPVTGNELFNISFDVQQLSNQMVVLSYEPETIEDQEIIDGYGGIDNTPAYLVRLRPVLEVNGERMVVGKDGLPMGMDYQLTIELQAPGSELQTITNTNVVGNLSVIGIVAQKTVPPSTDNSQPETRNAEQILYEEAMNYIDRWNQAEEELGSLLQLAITRPIPTIATVGGVIDVTYLLDTPHGFEWKGVFVDANLRTIETVQSERQKTFMQISGLQGSILENRLFEDDFQVESISTAKLLMLTRNTQPVTEVLTIDKSNIASVLPTLPFDENIKEDITNAVNQNFKIRIPQSEVTYEDWTGVGYIKENPETGESGYMLSGMIAGGMTAWGVDKWPKQLSGKFKNPYSEPPNYDPTSATYIQKITATDLQKGRVGETLKSPLQVIVQDKKKKPVPNVEVTFTIKAGGGNFSGSTIPVTVKTDERGIASVQFTLGKETSANPTYMREENNPNAPYPQQVGENIVDASLASGTKITKPFTAYGFPGDADHIEKLNGKDGIMGQILSLAGFISIAIQDKNGNSIANVPVTFSASDVSENPGCNNPNQDVRQAMLLETDDPCLKGVPTLEEINKCATAKSSLNLLTTSNGAGVEVILGAIPNADYSISVTSGNLKTDTFHLFTNSFGNCSGTDDPSYMVAIKYTYSADRNGNNINAGKVNTTIPVRAKLYYIREKDTQKEVDYNCYGTPITCTKVIGTREYETWTDIQSPSVKFDQVEGASVEEGLYQADYPLQAGENIIQIIGTGSIGVKWTSDCYSGTCVTTETNLNISANTTMTVYGVDIQVDPTPISVVDENGYALNDYKISYTINPSEYKALTAFMFIYKNDQLIAQIPTELSGTGTATISRGFWFDIKSTYKVQVVLNQGTGVEIRSDFSPLSFKCDISLGYSERQNRYDDIIKCAAITEGIDPLITKEVISKENDKFDNELVKTKDSSTGLMQVTPGTARSLGLTGTDEQIVEQLKNPCTNIEIGTKYLAQGQEAVRSSLVALGIPTSDENVRVFTEIYFNGGAGVFSGIMEVLTNKNISIQSWSELTSVRSDLNNKTITRDVVGRKLSSSASESDLTDKDNRSKRRFKTGGYNPDDPDTWILTKEEWLDWRSQKVLIEDRMIDVANRFKNRLTICKDANFNCDQDKKETQCNVK